MTAVVDIVEFRSNEFAPILPEESQVNPDVYGAESAFWLCTALARRGVATTYPESEDWGSFIEYFPASGSEFAVHCGNIDGAKDIWLLSLRTHGRKMFWRNKPPFSEASKLLAEIRSLIEAEPSIYDIKWLYSDDDT